MLEEEEEGNSAIPPTELIGIHDNDIEVRCIHPAIPLPDYQLMTEEEIEEMIGDVVVLPFVPSYEQSAFTKNELERVLWPSAKEVVDRCLDRHIFAPASTPLPDWLYETPDSVNARISLGTVFWTRRCILGIRRASHRIYLAQAIRMYFNTWVFTVPPASWPTVARAQYVDDFFTEIVPNLLGPAQLVLAPMRATLQRAINIMELGYAPKGPFVLDRILRRLDGQLNKLDEVLRLIESTSSKGRFYYAFHPDVWDHTTESSPQTLRSLWDEAIAKIKTD